MTLELMAIIAATITLGGLSLAQSRAAARERAEIRKRVDQLEVSLTDRMGQLEVSLVDRMGRLEVSLVNRMARLEVSLGERIARLEGSVDVLREHFVGTGRDAA